MRTNKKLHKYEPPNFGCIKKKKEEKNQLQKKRSYYSVNKFSDGY